MRISTWNINGLRSSVRSGFEGWLASSKSDLVCLQEVKMQEDMFSQSWFDGYNTYWNTALKTGYSGVATLVTSALTPLRIDAGIGDQLTDKEGRVLTTEFETFILVNTYAPHSHRKLFRLETKLSFCRYLIQYLQYLNMRGKPIIIVGDLNVAYQDIDLANPDANRKNAGFLPEERAWFDSLLKHGFVDAFRIFFSGKGYYTWWSMRQGVRDRNVGWRLDYILVDIRLQSNIQACYHSPFQLGSDHCPVTMDIDL